MRSWKICLIGLAFAACNKTSTQGLLDADLIVSGRSAIKLSTPANSATFFSEASLVFSWADVPGVAMSSNRGGNTVAGPTLPGTPSVVFQGYVAGDPTTFAFKPNTIADMDNNGAYDASVDAGANTATAGLVALP